MWIHSAIWGIRLRWSLSLGDCSPFDMAGYCPSTFHDSGQNDGMYEVLVVILNHVNIDRRDKRQNYCPIYKTK